MRKHVLQWHITDRCNLRCRHCYQDDYSEDLTLAQISKILDDYELYLKTKSYRGHINLTGGEPFVYPQLFEVLDMLEARKITFGLLTNGTLLDEAAAERLSRYRYLSFVQISLDGTKKTHEYIRGTGTFDKSRKAIRYLNRYKICTMVSFTAQKSNISELKSVIRLVKRWKVKRFWTDRLIPINNEQEIISSEEFLQMVHILTKEAEKAKKNPFCHTQIHCNRALQFCAGYPVIYHCSAGNKLLTILSNGDLLPCRRLPIVLGNVLSASILSLCEDNPVLDEISKIPDECRKCYKAETCRGGLRCLSYAVTKKMNQRDINCPYVL